MLNHVTKQYLDVPDFYSLPRALFIYTCIASSAWLNNDACDMTGP